MRHAWKYSTCYKSLMLQTQRLHTKSDLEASLLEVLTWFEQFKASIGVDRVWMECQLALVEGFTNAVRHAHQHLAADTPIELEASIQGRMIELRIWDCGAAFDLQARLRSAPAVVSPLAEGGRGLVLLQKIADELEYSRTADQRNCLRLVKRW